MTKFFDDLADQVPEYAPGDLGRAMGEPVAGGPPGNVLREAPRRVMTAAARGHLLEVIRARTELAKAAA